MSKPNFVIARAPYRISFFGGGTDYPDWYRENAGAVLATTIDKYCYLICRWLPPFFDYKHRIVWSQIETVNEPYEIKHPAIRETLNYLGISRGLEIHHAGDLPARTGMGTSSSFTVSLIEALNGLRGVQQSKISTALDAIHIEQTLIGEAVGSQDQTLAAFGGFNRIDFSGHHRIKVKPIAPGRLRELEKHLMLFFTGFSRTGSQIAQKHIKAIPHNEKQLRSLYQLVNEGEQVLTGHNSLLHFGELLDENWRIKRELTKEVSTAYIDYLYDKARQAGAIGGKLLGAGGGGFLLLFVEPKKQEDITKALGGLLSVPFKFEQTGAQIIFKGNS